MKYNVTIKKMLLLFSVILLVFFLLGHFFLTYYNKMTQEHTFSSIQTKADLIVESLSATFEQIHHTATEMAEQKSLQRTAYPDYFMSNYDQAKEILQIQEQQTSIKNANPFIHNFKIYYLKKNQAYNCANGQFPSFHSFTLKEYQELYNAYNNTDILYIHNGKLSQIIVPVTGSYYIIQIELSASMIENLLEGTYTEYDFYYTLDVLDSAYQLSNLSTEQSSQLLENSDTQQILIDGKSYHCFTSNDLENKIAVRFYLPTEQLFSHTEVIQYLNIIFILFLVLASIIFLYGSYTIIHKPINILITAFNHIKQQDYGIRIASSQKSDFTYLYNEFNDMAKKLGLLIENNYQQEILLNKAELKQLQAQVNPHFLYNSFFLLRRILHDELYDEARRIADTLGSYFQYITRNSQDNMTLKEEYQHAKLYCDIQAMRFEGRIDIETDILPEEYHTMIVPKLIIQPIIENAFNYGLNNKDADGLLKISVSASDSHVIISVDDNGEELSDDKLYELQTKLQSAANRANSQEMTGILNIQRRLAIFYNNQAYLETSRSSLGGLHVQLMLPISQTNKETAAND